MGTLLLNASFEPIHVIPERRAVVLVMAGKAELIEEKPGRFRSATTAVPNPAVVRLSKFVHIPYRARVLLTRRSLIKRDKGVCQYCGRRGDTIDHIVPRSKGGPHEWENVALACSRCNSKKADRTLAELGWTLPSTPYAPAGTFWVTFQQGEIPEQWAPYLPSVA